MTYLLDSDLIEVREVRMPRGASRHYTVVVECVTVDVDGNVTLERDNLTGAKMLLVVKADIDDDEELFRRESGVSYGPIGRIEFLSVADLIDGETFTLNDSDHTPTIFEFDLPGDGVTPGNVAIDLSAAVSADDVRDTTIEVINATGDFDITAEILDTKPVHAPVPEEADVYPSWARLYGLDATGATGNTESSHTVADPGFVVTDMVGGTDNGFEIMTQAGDTVGYASFHVNHPATEDIRALKNHVFEVWAILADGRIDAVIDESPFVVLQRVPTTLI